MRWPGLFSCLVRGRAASCRRAPVGQGRGSRPHPDPWTERRASGDRGSAAARPRACGRCVRVRPVRRPQWSRAPVGLASSCVRAPLCVRALARVRAGVRPRVRARARVRVQACRRGLARVCTRRLRRSCRLARAPPPVARPRARFGDRRGKSKKGESRERK